ncbi:hypothetical protein JOF29_001332 [Kribbella aluminosa]|uniref:Uncharacterized protein n=1 Tax=Kribbella aluminosa TaxID=416017 RepID=A0ABS4UF29_9ACTN|nr:hypothetical protein [Kribbella aluminosa]MBP2350249.1 hypothetical protein [Kribbella aluminosa]
MTAIGDGLTEVWAAELQAGRGLERDHHRAGRSGSWSLVHRRTDARKRKLRIGQQYVRNLPTFRYWLADLLEEHRRTSNGG